MDDNRNTTIVTAADANFAWGVLLLAASMRMNGMKEPFVAGAVRWPDIWKRRLAALDGVTVLDLAGDRRVVACQKPEMMLSHAVKTPWVTWADCDAIFKGNCSDLLLPRRENEILIRPYDPPPADFTPANLAVWRRDVGERDEPRLATRVNNPFISIHRSQAPFLERWRDQMLKVLPMDVGIIMKHGTPYFQTDESVLGSLLCFANEAPAVADPYTMDGRTVNGARYFAHLSYNPKPWQMWNAHCLRWYDDVLAVRDWLLARGIVSRGDLPFALQDHPRLHRSLAPLAPHVWRLKKLRRRLGSLFR